MQHTPYGPPRQYIPDRLRSGAGIELDDPTAHHVARVLRMQAGDPLILFDGSGGEYEASIAALERSRVSVAVGAHRVLEREARIAITVAQGVSSADRMDLTVQKAVELGVFAIQPVMCERSVVRLSAERAASRLEHWRRIVVATCEQCGRNRLPEVRPVLGVPAYCARPDPVVPRLLFSPETETRLSDAAARIGDRAVIAVGPEAGFSPAEEVMLMSAGFSRVSLGSRILRTETAAPAALAELLALKGEF
ncbi:MAG: 16S rRNA (uracil(1498)-N(3))-methyltransferase [Betaproteobacteria bacterium]|nr:16S rRNA (uracil(1498)-N(3))-methyltransferase [Betaproteobacteria bacterium]